MFQGDLTRATLLPEKSLCPLNPVPLKSVPSEMVGSRSVSAVDSLIQKCSHMKQHKAMSVVSPQGQQALAGNRDT